MKSQLVLAVLTIGLLAAPASSAAQTVQTEVTLKVPLNLTQLGPDVAKVSLGCAITSAAITTNANHNVVMIQEVPVSGGQLVTTVAFVFVFTGLDNPVGKSAAIVCDISGFSTSQQAWLQFGENAANPAFRTKPSVSFLDASFVW